MLVRLCRCRWAGLCGCCRLPFHQSSSEAEDSSSAADSIVLGSVVAASQADSLAFQLASAVGVASIAFLVAVDRPYCVIESRRNKSVFVVRALSSQQYIFFLKIIRYRRDTLGRR